MGKKLTRVSQRKSMHGTEGRSDQLSQALDIPFEMMHKSIKPASLDGYLQVNP